MYGTYIGNNTMLIKPLWGGFLLAPSTDMSLMPSLLTHGVFDISLTNYLIQNIKKGYTIIDAGANIGYFTILMGFLVGEEGKVIAYEANPNVFNILANNSSLNGMDPVITLHNKAVFSTQGKLSFYLSENFQGNGSIQEPNDNYFKHFSIDKINKIEVEAEPLDIYLHELNFIDFIKLDIEGAEYEAFLGMESLFKNKKIGTVVFELNRLMLGNKWQSLFELLNKYQEAYNFAFFTIDNQGLAIPIELKQLSLSKLTQNIIIKC